MVITSTLYLQRKMVFQSNVTVSANVVKVRVRRILQKSIGGSLFIILLVMLNLRKSLNWKDKGTEIAQDVIVAQNYGLLKEKLALKNNG